MNELISIADYTFTVSNLVAWLTSLILSSAALIGGFKVVNKSVIKPGIAHFRAVNEFMRLIPAIKCFLDNTLPTLIQAAKQVNPNGGTSLSDKVERIEAIVSKLEEQTEFNGALAKFNLENSTTPVFICDEAGRNEFVNHAYTELLKCDSSEVLDFGWKTFVAHEEEYEKVWRQAFTEARSFRCYLHMTDSKNIPIYTVIQTACMKREGGKKFLGLMQKITQEAFEQGRSMKASSTAKIRIT